MKDDRIAADELWRDPRLRIALVTETYPPEINGVAMTLQRMVDGLIARGHRVQLIRPRQGRSDDPQVSTEFSELLARGWKVPRYDGLRFGLPAKTALGRSWSHLRPDLVHVATEGPLGWSAVSVANRLRIPVTSDFHTNFDHYSRHYGVGWLRQPVSAYLRRFHNRTARTFVPTSAMAGTLREQGYRNLSVVARGVDTTRYTPTRRDDALRHSWGIVGDAPAVVHVGRLAPEKNLDLVVRAFNAIRKQRPDARMIFVGDGPARQALARANPDFVFAGMRTGDDLAAHYASSDVFLFPSLTETFGNVTLEALASGLCVVAYRYAAAAEVITDGVDGLVAECGDETGFIAHALRGATDMAFRAVIGSRARERTRDLDWDTINDRFAAELVSIWSDAARAAGHSGGAALLGEVR